MDANITTDLWAEDPLHNAASGSMSSDGASGSIMTADGPDDPADGAKELRVFMKEAEVHPSFDQEDVDAIDRAIKDYEAQGKSRAYVRSLLRDRVSTLQTWGARIDFATTHRALGDYFLQKHETLVKAVGAP